MNISTLLTNQTEILGRAIDCHDSGISPEVAQFMLTLQLAAEDERRMNELAQKARLGLITDEENVELEEFRRCGRLIEMLKLKSRRDLRT